MMHAAAVFRFDGWMSGRAGWIGFEDEDGSGFEDGDGSAEDETERGGGGGAVRIAMHVDGRTIRGNERQAVVLARELARRGHAVAVSCIGGSEVQRELRREAIETTATRPRGDVDPFSALAFAHWLRRGRFDAVLLTSWKRAFVAGAAARLAGVRRVVLRVGGVHEFPRGAAGRLFRRAFLRNLHAVVANSRHIASALRERIPALPTERIFMIPNGVSFTAAPPAPLRCALGLGADDLLAVTVGALEWRKGMDRLLGALAGARAPRLHLALAGDGPDRAALQERARALGVAGRVHFLGERRDVPAVLAAADLFVIASVSEGFSVAMLEAMAAGLPVISTDVGGAWEALAARDGRPAAGWTVAPGDAHALASALGEVSSAVRRGSAAVRARVDEASWRVDRWFSVNAMVDRVEAALRAGESR